MPGTEHPHLLFSKDEAEQLRSRLRKGRRSRVHLEHAVGCCEQFTHPSSPQFFDFTDRRSDYWHCRQGNFVIPARLLTLALTGWLADRPEFLRTAADAILAMVRGGVVDGLGDYTTWRKNPAHDAGKYFKTIGLLYDLLYQTMDDDERRTLVAHADETLLLAKENVVMATWSQIDNNRGGRFAAGLSVLGVAMEHAGGEQGELAATYANYGGLWVEKSLRHAFGRDGAPFEGPSYGTSHGLFLAVAAPVLARSGRRDCQGDARFGRIGDYLVQETVYSEGWVNNLNDCNKTFFPQIAYYAGVMHGRPACLWLWDQFGCNPAHPLALVHPEKVPDDFYEIPWYLLWPDDEAPEAAPPGQCGYPRAQHFRDRGVVSMRSGWEPDDLHVTMMSGMQMRTCHRQADQNQVTLYALGERFLIDTGYTATDSKTGEQLSGKPAEAHNAVLIGELAQSLAGLSSGEGWPVGRIESFVLGESNAYVLGDAREAYQPNGTIRRADRHIHTIWEPDLAPYVLWLDDIEADGQEHLYTLLLHTAPGNRFEWDGGRIAVHGSGQRLDIHLATSEPVTIREGRYGDQPRLHLEMRAVRARYLMLLHPRSADGAPAGFDVELTDDCVTATVRIDGRTARHRFDTRQRPAFSAGQAERYVEGPEWTG